MEKYEHLVDKAGKWGLYQQIISFLVIFTSLYSPMILLVLPMMQKVPSFSYTEGTETITDRYTFCTQYYYNQPFKTIHDKIVIESDQIINWTYQLKYVCGTKAIFSLVGTIFFVASICSNLTFSKFPDRYGRRTIFLFNNFLSLIAMIQLVYLTHLGQLIFCSFAMGVASLNLALSSIILNEVVDHKYSGLVMGAANAMFPLGGICHALIIYFLQDWRYYLYIMILICIGMNVLGLLYLQESPKWLLANKNKENFKVTIRKIAEINGNELDIEDDEPEIRKELLHTKSSGMKEINPDDKYRKYVYSVWDLIRFPSLRWITLGNLYLWVITGFSFFGILLNLEGLTGNIFTDAFITYIAEFIAEMGSGIAATKFGRKYSTLVSFVLATIGSVLFMYVKYWYFDIIFLFIGVIGVASAFNLLYIYTPELLPTNTKSLAMSVFSTFNRAAGGVVPILLTYTTDITFIIFAMSLGAVFVVLTLRESMHFDAGDEIKEIEEEIYEEFPLENAKKYISLFSI
jgi:OCT family organic cation transporter-like MFS transporter 4/5